MMRERACFVFGYNQRTSEGKAGAAAVEQKRRAKLSSSSTAAVILVLTGVCAGEAQRYRESCLRVETVGVDDSDEENVCVEMDSWTQRNGWCG
jgi:hypothetical protein